MSIKNLELDNSWEKIGLDAFNVTSLVKLNNGTLIASTATTEIEDHEMFQTLDNGKNWDMLRSWCFDEPYCGPLLDFDYDATNGVIYASGMFVVSKSSDNELTWKTLAGGHDQGGSGLKRIFFKSDDFVFAGGQNGIEEFTLLQIDLKANSNEIHRNWLPAPSTVKKIGLDPTNKDKIIIGAEGVY